MNEPEDKNKYKHWICVSWEDGEIECLEVYDVMHCIDGPGDCGWVTRVHEGRSIGVTGLIAHFENLSSTRALALAMQVKRSEKLLRTAEAMHRKWMFLQANDKSDER